MHLVQISDFSDGSIMRDEDRFCFDMKEVFEITNGYIADDKRIPSSDMVLEMDAYGRRDYVHHPLLARRCSEAVSGPHIDWDYWRVE